MLNALMPAMLIVAGCFASGIILLWLFLASPARRTLDSCLGVVPVVLGVIAVMFSLLSAFMASEVWSRRALSVAAVQAEAGGLRAMLRVSDAVGATTLRAAALDYTRVVVEREWPALAARHPQDIGWHATQALFDLVLADPVLLALPAGPQAMLRDALGRIREARTQRLRLAGTRIASGNWLALGLLAVLTQAVLCAVHIGQKRAMVLAMLLLSAGIATVLSMLALNDEPFFGFAAVTEVNYMQVLRDFPVR